jgi:UDP-N-acetylmuramoyl-tripeptide--D-alanyl-D-alanine ligase
VIAVELAEVARVTGGRLTGGADPVTRVTGPIVIDSRRVEPGSLFVCLPGERVDGHDFAAQAVAAGAVASLASREPAGPAVVVDDVETALASLATAVLEKSRCRVVGVTGSSGKTSTKDLLAAVFTTAGPTVAAEGSFNNELGLPLTALRVTENTETLVLEYSARGVGHIRYLCGIARPDIAIVLNVGDAHLGEFGSRDAIAAAKGELVEALSADGTAVLNADDAPVAAMSSRTSARVVTFGAAATADVRVVDLTLDKAARPRFRLVTPQGEVEVSLALHGRHQAFNAAAAVAAAFAAGIDVHDAVTAIEATTSISAHRMHVRERSDGLVVIDDAYNANPDSVRAALRALSGMRRSGRLWAVLGPMRELGADGEQLHADVGREAAELAVDELVVVGGDAAAIADGASSAGAVIRVRRVPNADTAATTLLAEVQREDVVLVKASNSERLWRVADQLLSTSAATVSA